MLKASSSSSASAFDRISYIILVIGVMPLMTASALRSRIVSSLSSTSTGQWLGSISYSVYLWHFPIAAVLAMLAAATNSFFLRMLRLC